MSEINPAIKDMITQKKLSPVKVKELIFLKKLIDKVASRPYLPDVELEKIVSRFGVKPDILTWGDYFQTQVAGEHWEKDDADFETIIKTIYFDIVASAMIFTRKSPSFFTEIENSYMEVCAKEKEMLDEQDEEVLHLHILKNYFEEMEIRMSALSEEDFDFFKTYAENRVAS